MSNAVGHAGQRVVPNPFAQEERQRQATRAGLAVRGTFSPAGPARPTVGAGLAQTLGALIGMNTHLAALGISADSIAARGLRECEQATDLESAETGADGRDHLLVPSAAEAWRRLKAAALADGITLFIVSAFRSIDRQAEIVRRKLDTGISLNDVLAVCAPPGFSEHHTGRAVDISTPGSQPLEAEFEQTTAYAWLQKSAAGFGYRLSYPVGNPWGYQYEPWHWCFHDAQPGSAADARESQRHA